MMDRFALLYKPRRRLKSAANPDENRFKPIEAQPHSFVFSGEPNSSPGLLTKLIIQFIGFPSGLADEFIRRR